MLLEERYVNFICENKITQGQFLLLYLAYKKRMDLILKYKQTFPADDGTMIGKYLMDDLINRGWLEKVGENLQVSPAFKTIFCDKVTVAEELFAIYPSTTEISGTIVPLTAVDLIQIANLYDDAIMNSIIEHEEVLKDIKYANENNMLNLSILKFVQSKYWLAIRKKRITTTDDAHESKQSKSFG